MVAIARDGIEDDRGCASKTGATIVRVGKGIDVMTRAVAILALKAGLIDAVRDGCGQALIFDQVISGRRAKVLVKADDEVWTVKLDCDGNLLI